MGMLKSKKLIKDINTLIGEVIGFEKFIWLLAYIMVFGFLMGIMVGLN